MPVPPRHLRFDDNTTLGLRNADHAGWTGALGSIVDLPRLDGPVGDDLVALGRTLTTWGRLEAIVSARERQAARFWMPGRTALAALLAAVVFAAVGAWMGWRWMFRLAPPALAVGMILSGANWIARRILDRRRQLEELRGKALAIVEGLATRTFLGVAGATVVECRGYRTTLRRRDVEAERSIQLATEKGREVDSTIAIIRATNRRLARAADDGETRALTALRQRLASELQGLQIARAEIARRQARLDEKFGRLAVLAEREALSHRATALLDERAPRTPDPTADLSAGLAEMEAEVAALDEVLDGARARVDATIEASTVRMSQATTRASLAPAEGG